MRSIEQRAVVGLDHSDACSMIPSELLRDGHIEFEQSVTYPNHGVVELEPQRSKLSGKELAAAVQPRINEIAGLIADKERVIAELAA